MMDAIAEMKLHVLRKEDVNFKMVYFQIFCCYLCSITLHLPYYFHFPSNETKAKLDIDLQHLWNIFQGLYTILIKIVPLLAIVVLNIALVRKLKIIWNRRRATRTNVSNIEETQIRQEKRKIRWSVSNTQSLKEQRMALVLVMIAFTFVVFTLPASICFICNTFINHFDLTENLVFIHVTNLMESSNYSLNFYLYILIHKEIRTYFLEFCKNVKSCLFYHETYSYDTTTNRSVVETIEMSKVSLPEPTEIV